MLESDSLKMQSKQKHGWFANELLNILIILPCIFCLAVKHKVGPSNVCWYESLCRLSVHKSEMGGHDSRFYHPFLQIIGGQHFYQLWFWFLYFTQMVFIHPVSGISDSYQMGIFQILAGILHLGNVGFTSRDSDSCTIPVSCRWVK